MRIGRTIVSWLEAWCLWIVVTAVAWAIGLVWMGVIGESLGPMLGLALSLLLGSLPGGVLIGLAQYYFLRPPARELNGWLGLTTGGYCGGLLVAALVVLITGSQLGILLGGLLGGLLVSLLQLAAFHPDVRTQRSWVLQVVSGWGAAALIGASQMTPQADGLAVALTDTAVALVAGFAILCTLALTALIVAFPQRDRAISSRTTRWW